MFAADIIGMKSQNELYSAYYPSLTTDIALKLSLEMKPST